MQARVLEHGPRQPPQSQVDPLSWGLEHHVPARERGWFEVEEEEPLWPCSPHKGFLQEDPAEPDRPTGIRIGLLPAACMCALFCAPSSVFLLAALGSAAQALLPKGGPGPVHSVTPVPEIFCAQKLAGIPAAHVGNSSRMPRGKRTVYAGFRTRTAGQTIASWHGGCASLQLSDGGFVEYSEGRDIALRHLVDSSRGSVTDGNWHSTAVRRFENRGDLYVDDFLVASGHFPSDGSSGCGGELKSIEHFEGNLDSLRVFDEPLSIEEMRVVGTDPCVFPATSSTTSTFTTSSTWTTTSTTTSATHTTSSLSTSTITTSSTGTSTTTRSTTSTFTATATSTSTSRTTTATTTLSSSTSSTLTSTSTYTTTHTPAPVPAFSAGVPQRGSAQRPAAVANAQEVAVFPGAELPNDGLGMTLLISMQTAVLGRDQEILAWGTSRRDRGCVSLHLTSSGNLQYSERPAGADTRVQWGWQNVSAAPAVNLADGALHRLAVTRGPGGVTYLFADHELVGQGVLPEPRPWNLPAAAHAGRTCGPADRGDLAFLGTVSGLRIYAAALTGPQLEVAMTPPAGDAADAEIDRLLLN